MMLQSDGTERRRLLYNVLFGAVCAGILVFLLNAPPETTVRLPDDDIHMRFYPMERKKAEKYCAGCHEKDGVAPLPEGHPPKYRCLFCHRKKERPGGGE